MNIRDLFVYRGTSTSRADVVLAVCAFIGFIGFWYAVAEFEIVSQRYLPLPHRVVTALHTMLTEQNFIEDIWISVARVWGAFLLSAVMAIPVGIWMSSYRIVGTLTEPIVDFIRYLPVPALVPLLIIWFGIGESSKIAVLWMGTFFQLVLLIADDAKRVPREFIEIGFTLGAKPRQITWDIVHRSMLPKIVDNLRITLGWCWTYIIIAEIVAANAGIGHAIWSARRFVKTPEVMAGILTVGIIGLLTDQVIRLAHRRMFRYL
ncbi:MAG: ABC transporter permease [Gammaproteobacteria bacterium]|nr:ABC transporter permease [Gammaproteobacteria bacterium]